MQKPAKNCTENKMEVFKMRQKTYYLTDMNQLLLENHLLQFLLHNQTDQKLQNGITSKIATMMYNNHIDYYYSDHLATAVKVPINHIDNVYLYGYDKYYQKPLAELLTTANAPATVVANAPLLEETTRKILTTKRLIRTKKPRQKISNHEGKKHNPN